MEVINLHLEEVALTGEEALNRPTVTPINHGINNNMYLFKVVTSSKITLLKISLINNNMVKSTMIMDRNNITHSKTPTTNNLSTLSSSNSHYMCQSTNQRGIKNQNSSSHTINSRNRPISNLQKVTKNNINPNISLRLNNKSISLKLSSNNLTGRLLSIILHLFSRLITMKRKRLLSISQNLRRATIKRRLSLCQPPSNISR